MGTPEAEESEAPDLWQKDKQSLTHCTPAEGLGSCPCEHVHTHRTKNVYTLTHRNTYREIYAYIFSHKYILTNTETQGNTDTQRETNACTFTHKNTDAHRNMHAPETHTCISTHT